MSIFGWHVSFHREYCLRPFFRFEGRYFSGNLKVAQVGPLGVRFSRGGL
jgi:hypothetical protein